MRFDKITKPFQDRLKTHWPHQCSARAAQNILDLVSFPVLSQIKPQAPLVYKGPHISDRQNNTLLQTGQDIGCWYPSCDPEQKAQKPSMPIENGRWHRLMLSGS